MERLRFFEVMKNSDRTEGRGPLLGTGIAFINKDDAVTFAESKEYADRWGVMGTPGGEHDVWEREVVVFNDYAEFNREYPQHERERLKRQALKKLTQEERVALGV